MEDAIGRYSFASSGSLTYTVMSRMEDNIAEKEDVYQHSGHDEEVRS